MPTEQEIAIAAKKQGITKKEAAKRIFGHLQKLKEKGEQVK